MNRRIRTVLLVRANLLDGDGIQYASAVYQTKTERYFRFCYLSLYFAEMLSNPSQLSVHWKICQRNNGINKNKNRYSAAVSSGLNASDVKRKMQPDFSRWT